MPEIFAIMYNCGIRHSSCGKARADSSVIFGTTNKWGVLLSILSKSFSMKTFVESNLQSMSFGTFSVDVIRLVPISVHLLKVPFC